MEISISGGELLINSSNDDDIHQQQIPSKYSKKGILERKSCYTFLRVTLFVLVIGTFFNFFYSIFIQFLFLKF